MTLDELKKEILALGYAETIDSNDLFLTSANRALWDIYSKREILKTIRLFATGQRPSVYYKEIHCEAGKSVTLPLVGSSYSMRICGEGNYRIEDGDKVSISQFSTGFEPQILRGFIAEGGIIKFYGSTSFMVLDFSVYDESYTNVMQFIPDGSNTVIFNIRELAGDFMSFISPATDAYGNDIEGARMYDGKLEIPATFRGEIRLRYRVQPPLLTPNNADDIDIPDEYVHLLPLITASYVWLDADPTKARYYKSLYEDIITVLGSKGYQKLDFNYEKGGWA